jgi:hypothetical protein
LPAYHDLNLKRDHRREIYLKSPRWKRESIFKIIVTKNDKKLRDKLALEKNLSKRTLASVPRRAHNFLKKTKLKS